jgi:formate hydrogenlyase subunit 6/NADH:ubiquinone oxidoreductase subunit I
MFCWMCVEACPFDALTMTPDYEQSVTDPRELIRTLEQLTARGLEFAEVQRPAAPDA